MKTPKVTIILKSKNRTDNTTQIKDIPVFIYGCLMYLGLLELSVLMILRRVQRRVKQNE